MKAFRFSLEAALRWRKTQHAEEEQKLKRLLAYRDRILQDLQAVEKARREAALNQFAATDTTGLDFQMVARYLIGLKARQAQLAEALQQAEADVRKQRGVCAEAQRRVELLESLREKRLDTWRYEQELELEALAADAYLAKRARER